jgi:hypothetical protein
MKPPSPANKKGCTLEWLRTFEGCEHFTDQQATDILEALGQLAEMLFAFRTPSQLPKPTAPNTIISISSLSSPLKKAA